MFKVKGDSFGGKGEGEVGIQDGDFEIKMQRHKFQSKMNLCSKFHPNRTMGKCSKLGRKFQMD